MTKATRLIRAAMEADKTTRKGLTEIKLIRGRYSKIFLPMSSELYDSAMRTFDRIVGRMKPEFCRTSEEREACK